MLALNIAFWAAAGILPFAENVNYDVDALLHYNWSGYTELGVEADAYGFFAVGSIRSEAWRVSGVRSLQPDFSGYTVGFGWDHEWMWSAAIGAGYRLGRIELGWLHTCAHPVDAGGGALRLAGNYYRPRWESAHDELYIRVESGRP